ncbi:SMI1/KNR4 family protein [Actinophytocola sediminis]
MTVQTAWSSITTWLGDQAPTTASAVRAPASEDDIAETRAAIGRDLPDDLIAWWRLADGMDDYRAGFLIPAVYQPLPVAAVRDEYQRWSRYTDPDCCRSDGTHRAAGEAGFGFCTATVPICRDLGGDVLLVDLRDGPRHGVILSLMAEDGHHPTRWTTVAAMLEDVAGRLHTPGSGYEPDVIEDGVLTWV